MGKEKPTQKPTRDETAANLLRLGHLLHRFSYPTGPLGLTRALKPEEAERLKAEIASVSGLVESSVNDSRQWLLRSVMGVRGQEVVDTLVVRIIGYIAWSSLASERSSSSSVAHVANCVSMGDLAVHLEVRKTVRLMLTRGNSSIRYRETDFSESELVAGDRLILFLSGQGNPAVVFTEQSLKTEKEEWERKRNGKAKGKTSLSMPAGTSPPKVPETRAPLLPAQSPKAIFESLRRTVIGIDPVVRKFSIQMAIHMRRIAIAESGGVPVTPPVCVLLCGASGCGKSFLVSEFGRLSGLPFAVGDMSSVTASAYVGASADELFYGFARKGGSLADAQRGVLFLDEIDKKRTNNRGGDFDATGAGVQYELLRMLEGTRIQVGGKRGNDSVPKGVIDTSSMAFVMGGAFSSIADSLAEKTRCPMGFSGKTAGVGMAPDVRELLLEYFIPELVNRIGSVIVFPSPSHGQLVQIATAPEGTIARLNQYLGGSFGLQVAPSPEAIKEIASWALENRTFARGMRNLMQAMVEEAIFEERKGELYVGAGDVRKAIEAQRRATDGLVF